YDTRGSAYGVSVSGTYAYVADGWGGFRVIDVSDPAGPIEVGYYDTPGRADAVSVSGTYAYVAGYGDCGLRVIDVSDPASPIEVAYYDTLGSVHGVSVSGEYAYVAGGYDGLRVIDVSDPAVPIEVGYYDKTWGAYGVSVSGRYAYVVAGNSGLRVIDVSDPASPIEVAYYDTPGSPGGVSILGPYVYVADGSGGFRVIDISPELPEDTYRITLDGTDDADGAIKDAAGKILDGEGDYIFPLPVDSLPTGDDNPGGDAVFEFSIDTVPVVTVDELTTQDTTPSLSGTVDDPNATVVVTVAGNSYPADNHGDGTWTLPDNTIAPPLSVDAYDVQATATDLTGNVGNDTTTDELTIYVFAIYVDAAYDFGEVLLGNSPSREFTVRNEGTAEVRVLSTLGLEFPFSISPTNGGGSGDDWLIGAGSTRTFTVTYDGTVTLTLGSVSLPTGYSLIEALDDSLAAG
ncbi:hypothetical protein LCGC14_2619330, partial [marine sediment metagenome]